MAKAIFNGVMNDLGDHLFNTNRPPVPHLANGFAEWEKFGFGSLVLERAARRGLEKYCHTWNASLRKWYECEAHVELQKAQRKW